MGGGLVPFQPLGYLGASRMIYPVECLANMGLLPWTDLHLPFVLCKHPVGHWQWTGSKLAVSLIPSRVIRRGGPHGRVGLNASCLRRVATWDCPVDTGSLLPI